VQKSGFFKGQICGFTGGYVPFAATKTERLAARDPRPSLEERYGTQDGYMCVVRRAAEQLVQSRLLLREDADRTIAAAAAAKVLPGGVDSSDDARQIAANVCKSF
jgi:hypothetical protein